MEKKRGFEDHIKNQEYLKKIKQRIPKLQNKTNDELITALNNNQKRDEYSYGRDILANENETEVSVGDILFSKIKIPKQLPNGDNIPHGTQVVIKSRTDELGGIVIPSKELHLKMNENGEREETNTLKRIDDGSIPTIAIPNKQTIEKIIINPSININIGTAHFIGNKTNKKNNK